MGGAPPRRSHSSSLPQCGVLCGPPYMLARSHARADLLLAFSDAPRHLCFLLVNLHALTTSSPFYHRSQAVWALPRLRRIFCHRPRAQRASAASAGGHGKPVAKIVSAFMSGCTCLITSSQDGPSAVHSTYHNAAGAASFSASSLQLTQNCGPTARQEFSVTAPLQFQTSNYPLTLSPLLSFPDTPCSPGELSDDLPWRGGSLTVRGMPSAL